MYVYLLCDPISKKPRYVGWTRQHLSTRLRNHVTTARKNSLRKAPVHRWMASLEADPEIVLLMENATLEDEKWAISLLRRTGVDLLNQEHHFSYGRTHI